MQSITIETSGKIWELKSCKVVLQATQNNAQMLSSNLVKISVHGDCIIEVPKF